MTMARDNLKVAILQRLSEVATEHPNGHQGKLAARFILRSKDGDGIELMFEKGPVSAPNLWMHHKFAKPLLGGEIDYRESPAHGLFVAENEKGKKIYGRHAGLLAMRQLADADLVCFKIKSSAELDRMIDVLRQN